MSTESHSVAARGALAAGVSFLLWGLWPLYWRELQSVSSFELIAHRIVWSLLLLLSITLAQRTLSSLWAALAAGAVFGTSLLSGVLLATNWTIYVWAVNNGHVIDSSLGYFLTPLCNVALGFAFITGFDFGAFSESIFATRSNRSSSIHVGPPRMVASSRSRS